MELAQPLPRTHSFAPENVQFKAWRFCKTNVSKKTAHSFLQFSSLFYDVWKSIRSARAGFSFAQGTKALKSSVSRVDGGKSPNNTRKADHQSKTGQRARDHLS